MVAVCELDFKLVWKNSPLHVKRKINVKKGVGVKKACAR
jgi:hypothetical protein